MVHGCTVVYYAPSSTGAQLNLCIAFPMPTFCPPEDRATRDAFHRRDAVNHKPLAGEQKYPVVKLGRFSVCSEQRARLVQRARRRAWHGCANAFYKTSWNQKGKCLGQLKPVGYLRQKGIKERCFKPNLKRKGVRRMIKKALGRTIKKALKLLRQRVTRPS